MRRTRRLLSIGALAACVALAVAVAGAAGSTEVRIGNLILRADGGFQPQALPKRQRVPIRFQGWAKIRTTDRSVPPTARYLKLEFDRDGLLTTAGLPTCPPGRIEATTSKQARQRCRGAIVGTGQARAILSFPGSRVPVASPLTLFNGPRRGGNPTVVAHAQTAVPVFEAYVVVAEIERRRGTFGYRVVFNIPPIAGGVGTLTDLSGKVNRRYRSGGVERSYASARCSSGILRTQGDIRFDDGTVIYGSIYKGCRQLP